MSLNRISFLEGWECNPAAFLSRPDESENSDSDSYQDLPEGSVSSSFPSTYSRLNFNPYAGPGWNESPDDPSPFLGPSILGLSPTTTREGHVDSVSAQALASAERTVHEDSETDPRNQLWADTTGAYEVSTAKRIGMLMQLLWFQFDYLICFSYWFFFLNVPYNEMLTWKSPGLHRGCILLFSCRSGLRLCSSQTCPH